MKRKGFTLVELVVALSIFSMLLGIIYYILGTELSFWKKTVNAAEKIQLSNAVLTRIIRDARNAKEILAGSNQDVLALRIGPDRIEYSMANDKIKRKKNNYSTYLTDAGEIDGLSFNYPGAKLVEIRLEGFTTRACLRN
jgi:prepilin-type N-terminal cleavage/methylation domain-containing protein